MKRYPYRQVFLLVLVLALPALAIAIQGRRLVDQERLLARQQAQERWEEIQKRMAAEVGQDMFARLERIKVQEIANTPENIPRPGKYSDPAVILVGRFDGERLIWPWETDPRQEARRSQKDPEFDQRMQTAERAESTERNYERAADLYRALIESADNENQRASARLGLARTLAQSGAIADGIRIYRDLLNLPWNLSDEYGFSFASYAALSLAKITPGKDVLARVTRETQSQRVLHSDEIYRLRSILLTLQSSPESGIRAGSKAMLEELERRARELEEAQNLKEALDLQANFADLQVTPTRWQPFPGHAGELWLVGRTPAGPTASGLVLVVAAESIRKSVEAEHLSRRSGVPFTVLTGNEKGQPLGGQLPNLRVVFGGSAVQVANSAVLQRSFYGLSLFFVVPLTFLAGYLLWRDTRREVHIAELRSQFVSSVSHELKTPLTAIRMFAEALQMRGTSDSQVQSEYLETIVNESERLTRLLNNVLDFSRIERGQKNYRMEATPLEDVVRAVARTMQYPLAEQGFVLDLHVAEGVPPVAVDRDAIQQAILNLLTNAMKYSGKCRKIELGLSVEKGSVLIQVVDHGIGIPPREQVRIFEKFYRVPIPENRAISGTGLGLALVAHIVQAHGGTVQVQSSLGNGSTFSIRLPLEIGSAA